MSMKERMREACEDMGVECDLPEEDDFGDNSARLDSLGGLEMTDDEPTPVLDEVDDGPSPEQIRREMWGERDESPEEVDIEAVGEQIRHGMWGERDESPEEYPRAKEVMGSVSGGIGAASDAIQSFGDALPEAEEKPWYRKDLRDLDFPQLGANALGYYAGTVQQTASGQVPLLGDLSSGITKYALGGLGELAGLDPTEITDSITTGQGHSRAAQEILKTAMSTNPAMKVADGVINVGTGAVELAESKIGHDISEAGTDDFELSDVERAGKAGNASKNAAKVVPGVGRVAHAVDTGQQASKLYDSLEEGRYFRAAGDAVELQTKGLGVIGP